MIYAGYSLKTNQFGLAQDTILSYDLVLPSGEITNVDAESHPDLFLVSKGLGTALYASECVIIPFLP